MRKIIIAFIITFVFVFHSSSQDMGIKTNFAHWAAAFSPNLGMEFTINRKITLDIMMAYNALEFNDNKKFKHWLIKPEVRYWLYESYDGHFVGFHGIASEFNIGGYDLPIGRLKELKDFRFEGYAFGVGMSYGYQFPISNRMNLEFEFGLGYAHLLYDKFDCVRCGEKLESDVSKNYFGVTKTAVSLIYLF